MGVVPCLIHELLAPNVLFEAQSYASNGLPEKIAWEASKQTVQAPERIYANSIAQGGQPGLLLAV